MKHNTELLRAKRLAAILIEAHEAGSLAHESDDVKVATAINALMSNIETAYTLGTCLPHGERPRTRDGLLDLCQFVRNA